MPRTGTRTITPTISAPTRSRASPPTTPAGRAATRGASATRTSTTTISRARSTAQDDFRIRRNLTLSGGVRYEAQNHVDDFDNVMPRLGVTWAPGTAGTTTLRASWGIFTDWLPNGTYEQTLRVDGERQKEIDLANPPYPVVSDLSSLVAAPVGRYELADDLRAAPLDARQPRHRSPLQAGPGERHLCLHPRRRRHARREPERAGQRRAARSALRQRDRGRVRRQRPAASTADQPHGQPGRAVSAEQERAALQLSSA